MTFNQCNWRCIRLWLLCKIAFLFHWDPCGGSISGTRGEGLLVWLVKSKYMISLARPPCQLTDKITLRSDKMLVLCTDSHQGPSRGWLLDIRSWEVEFCLGIQLRRREIWGQYVKVIGSVIHLIFWCFWL